MENQNGSVELVKQEVPNAAETALFLITKAEIDTQIATAKAFPRTIALAMKKAEDMATITEEVAASCTYALPRDGKTIEGPSVRLAEIIVNTWGNIRAGARVIENDGKTITAQGICHDLESNTCFTVEVKKRITKKNGQKYSDDMIVTAGQAACAIAYRNAVYKVVPVALIDPIWERTKVVARGKAETLNTRREKALNYARSLGIKDEQICAKMDVAKVGDMDLDKLATFRAYLAAIKDGEGTVNDIFGTPEPETSNKESEEITRVRSMIADAKTVEAVEKIRPKISKLPEGVRNDVMMELENRIEEIQNQAA